MAQVLSALRTYLIRSWSSSARPCQKLEAIRHQPVATPFARPGHGDVGEARLGLDEAAGDHRAGGDDRKLVRRPREELYRARELLEEGVVLSIAETFDRTDHPDLSGELEPAEAQRARGFTARSAALLLAWCVKNTKPWSTYASSMNRADGSPRAPAVASTAADWSKGRASPHSSYQLANWASGSGATSRLSMPVRR